MNKSISRFPSSRSPRRAGPRAAGRVVALTALLWLAGCASQADLPVAQGPQAAGRLGLQAPEPGAAAELPAWWSALGDPVLDGLQRKALEGHPSIQAAAARLRQATALAEARGAADTPQLQLHGEVARQRFTEHGLYPPPVAGALLTTGTLQFQGSWELDLFGLHAAELQAAVGQQAAAQADAQAARLLLSSQVARTYVQLGRLLAQREVAARTLAQREELLSLVRQRVGAGLDTAVELRQGEGALPETRQQIEALDEQAALARHQLAALTAQPAGDLDGLAPRLDRLSAPALPAALPLNLLARRADVTALAWRARAAGAQVDSARTLFYPNVNLVAFAGLSAVGLDKFFSGGTDQYGVVPALDLPLFDGGRRRANFKDKVAQQDAAVAAYDQSILDAAREVADGITSAGSLERQRQQQAAAQASAEAAYDLALQRYRAGLGPYLSVLSAETGVLNQRRLGVDLQARRLDNALALVKALGGPWETGGAATASTPAAAAVPSTRGAVPRTSPAITDHPPVAAAATGAHP